MAASLSTAQDARGDLNLGALIAGKVKSSLAMSAEERKAREEEIKLLKEKVDSGKATQEEIVRLDQLEGQDKERKEGGIGKSFFAKAMMSEFGGDRLRRTKGTFSKNPDATQDPSLTKEQRFSALLDKAARPAAPPPSPAAPVATDDINPMDYGDGNAQAPTPQQGSLEKLLDLIKSQYSTLSARVSSLGSEEQKNVAEKNKTNVELSRMNGVLETFRQYFNKDNELKEKESQIEKDKVELELDKEQDAKVGAESANLAGQIDNAGFTDTETLDEQNEGKKDNGFLGGLMKTVGGLFNMFKGGEKTKGATQYTKPIGPQPMNSKTPWASKGAGDRGGMFGGAGFTPRMPSAPTSPTPLNKGGIVPPAPNQKPTKMAGGSFITDRPTQTRLSPGSSVIPLNRNNSLGKMFQQAGKETGSKEADPMTKVMQLPTQVGGGLLLTALNDVMSKLGGLGSMLKGPIKQIAAPVASMFGLPATVIGGLFGGAPAQAATGDPMKNRGSGFLDKLKGLLGKRSGGGNTPPPAVGGANLGATMRAGETIQAEDMQGSGGFYQGGSGLGSEGGQNTSRGYATHWHLGPPTNDAAGWAEARAVAKTSAQMMLARGSTIWFGNLKQYANPANLDAQIAAEQQAHSRPGRTQGGIDMQEKAPDGNMRLKFPLKVTNVTNDISSGSGRTARVQGSNVVLAHGAVGSANSIESSVMPSTANGRQQAPFTSSANGRQQQADPNRQTTGLTVTPEMQQAAPALMNLLVAQNQRQQAAPKQQVGPTGLSTSIGTTDPTGIDMSFYFRP
jgi:hypothetical protein